MSNAPLKPFLILALCCVPGACAAADSRTVPAYEITAVTVTADPDGSYRITATGHMRTGGHTNPRLRKSRKSAAGTLVLELVADAPPTGSMVPMYLQPVSAEYRMTSESAKRVIIVGERNEIRRRIPGR